MAGFRYKALLVGNTQFPNDPQTLLELKGPAHDVRLLKEALCHPATGLHKPEDVTTLLNEDSLTIRKHISAFFVNARPEDQLLFYYSGHGYKGKRSQQLYLCARDTITTDLQLTAITDVEINTRFIDSECPRLAIILDCCYSGKFKGGDLQDGLKGEGRWVMTSSRGTQLSRDSEADGPSAFTKYLVEALTNDAVDTNANGEICINEVYEYVYQRLYKETRQTATRDFDKVIGNIALGRRIRSESMQMAKTSTAKKAKPKLAISENEIVVRHVKPGEKVPDEQIEVYNEGSGSLNWEAACDAEWMTIHREKDHIRLSFTPKPGPNRANIRVTDSNGGGSKTIRVLIEVEEASSKPKREKAAGVELMRFPEVTKRLPEHAALAVDASESVGTLILKSDAVEFLSSSEHVHYHDIAEVTYLDKTQTNLPNNYVSVTAKDGTAGLFYKFSLWEEKPTLKMFNTIMQLVNSGQLIVSGEAGIEAPPRRPQSAGFGPGAWQVRISNFGQVTAVLHIDFQSSGTMGGRQQAGGQINPLQGTWGYDMTTRILMLYAQIIVGGIPVQDAVQIQLGEDAGGVITGFDLAGQQYVFRRV